MYGGVTIDLIGRGVHHPLIIIYLSRPAISLEQEGLRKLTLLHKLPRFRQLVHSIIVDMRAAKKQHVCAKPEDILNVTIQSQNAAKRLNHSQESLLLQQQSHQLLQQHQQVVDVESDVVTVPAAEDSVEGPAEERNGTETLAKDTKKAAPKG